MNTTHENTHEAGTFTATSFTCKGSVAGPSVTRVTLYSSSVEGVIHAEDNSPCIENGVDIEHTVVDELQSSGRALREGDVRDGPGVDDAIATERHC